MFQFLVAFRYLRSHRKAGAIFSAAVISVLGICAGVFSLNVVLAVMTGFQTELQKTILGASAHVLVSSYDGAIYDSAETERRIKLVAGVKAASPVIYGTGLLVSEYGSQGATVTGINPAAHFDAFPSVFTDIRSAEQKKSEDEISENTGVKRFFSALAAGADFVNPPMILGEGLARSLAVAKGGTVTLVSAADRKNPLRKRPKTQVFQVAEIFKYGMARYDAAVSYVNFADAARFFSQPGPVAFEVAVDEPLKSEQTARELEAALGFPFIARSWQEANSKLFSAIKLEKLGLAVLLGFIVFIASLSVMSVLVMMMTEKSADIAILRASGASQKQVGGIFVIIGAALGFAGSFLGTAAAFAVCYLIQNSETAAAFIPFDPEVYGISKFPVIINPLYFLTVGAASQLLSVAIALYPALCARTDGLAAKLKV